MCLPLRDPAALRTLFILLALSLLGISTHLLPHDMGITTTGAIGMLSAAFLPAHLIAVPVMIMVAVSDVAAGSAYGVLAMSIVYGAHILAALSVSLVLKRLQVGTVCWAAVQNALVFYLVSNIAPIALGHYPDTAAGWLLCYENGLPFLLRGIFANLIFGGVAFTAIHLWEKSGARSFFAAERH